MRIMGDIYKLFKESDRKSINWYLGQLSAFDVLRAYETVFGSPQILAYERDTLKAVIDAYLSSDDKSQRAFCDYLEFGISSQNDKAKRKSEKKIKRLERGLRFRCFLGRIFRRKDIANSLKRQFCIKENKN